jgi:hypothetical protein
MSAARLRSPTAQAAAASPQAAAVRRTSAACVVRKHRTRNTQTWIGGRAAVSAPLTVELSGEQLEILAERVAVILEARAEANTSGSSAWLRGAERIGKYIDAPRSRVYALASAGRIPVERDGSNLIARRSDLDAWLCAGGGKRP